MADGASSHNAYNMVTVVFTVKIWQGFLVPSNYTKIIPTEPTEIQPAEISNFFISVYQRI